MPKIPNEHITEYLKWYISDKCEKPCFAVLLKGGWGSGKTWFIKKFMNDNDTKLDNSKSSDSKFIYLSLYGLESIEDIDNQIFQELHPKLNSKAIKIAGRLAKSVLSRYLHELPDIELQEYLNKFGDKVLVFDDLERCNIIPEKLFGYINSFVEHQLKKIIIVANDKEIEGGLSDNEKEPDSKYHMIKEKIIGKTFKIETDIAIVINSLIEENAPSSKKNLSSHKDLLIDIFETVKEKACKEQANYRAFSHTIKDFEYLWVKIDKMYQKHAEFVKDFLNVFMRMGYELQLGLIKDKDVSNVERAKNARIYTSVTKNLKQKNQNEMEKNENENEYKDLEAFFDRHNLNFDNLIIPHDVWFQILCENNIDLDSIEESFDNSSYFDNETRPDWVRLWHYCELEDSDAEKLIELIAKKLDKFIYNDLGEIFHVYGALLRRIEEGLELPGKIGKTPQEVEEHAKKYIDYLYDNDQLPKRKDIAMQYMREAFGKFGYSFLDSENFISIRKYFLERCNERLSTLTSARAKEILDCMGDDTNEFYGLIASQDHNRGNDKPSYWNVAIFQNFEAEAFLDSYNKISNSHKRFFHDVFQERYKRINYHPKMKGEYSEFPKESDFMNKLLGLVELEMVDVPAGSPSAGHLKLFRDEGIKFAIEQLEQFKDEFELTESSPEGKA